ncbi:MAG: hypothetical protein LBK42_02060 [Propionibacteriaceae bacterium]|jgi:hypothetical protein|nr:hypothetical protein [Propionibacteriaceae bacterium]
MSIHYRQDGKERRVLVECDGEGCGCAVVGVGPRWEDAACGAYARADGWDIDVNGPGHADFGDDYCPAHKGA